MVREYGALAPAYDERWASYVEGTARMTVEALGNDVTGRMLDIGCGTGVLLERVGEETPDVQLHGTDLSFDMLEMARQRLRGSARLVRSHAEVLPYRRGEFDTATSMSVLHFVPEPREALAEARRVLRPGGTFVLTDWCRDFVSMKILDAWLRWRDPAHGRTHGSAEAVTMLEEVGFHGVTVNRARLAGLWGIMTLKARA